MARRGGANSDKIADLPKAKLSVSNLKKSSRLFTYLGREKWVFVLGMFFLLGTAGVGLVFPLVAGKLFSFFGDNSPAVDVSGALKETGVVLFWLLLVQGLFSFGRVYTFSLVTENILRGLRNNTFARLVQMPMGFFSKSQVSELSSRIATDINVISEAFTVSIAEVIRQSIVGLGGIIMLVTQVQWEIAKWFLIIILPIVALALIFGKGIRKMSKDFQSKIAESNVIVGEALSGIANVKTFTNETLEISRYEKVTAAIRTFGLKYGRFRGSFFSFVVSGIFGAIFFIIYKMVEMKNAGTLTAEDFGKFMMLAVFVAGSLGGLPDQIASIQRALGATDRVFELIDGEIEGIDLNKDNAKDPLTIRGEIEFKNVVFHYPTRPDFQVLKGVSFKVEKGQTVALVGPSGSGKSTIASMILRFYDAVEGHIQIDGKDAQSYNLTSLRRHMAVVPQDVMLFAGTIRDNIAYGKPGATDDEVETAARQANAYDFIQGFPEKWNTLVGERGIQLSGGQRQRIAIARAVLKNPEILILDEATSSLDSESEKLVQEALDKLMVGRTSVVIAHRLSTIRKADKIVVLEKGEIKESGTHQELINREDGLYKSLSKLQFELS